MPTIDVRILDQRIDSAQMTGAPGERAKFMAVERFEATGREEDQRKPARGSGPLASGPSAPSGDQRGTKYITVSDHPSL